VGIVSYLGAKVTPFVANRLHEIGEVYTCRSPWQKNTSRSSIVLQPAPLPASATYDFGYGRRTGAAMTVDVRAEATLGEYIRVFNDYYGVRQGEKTGVVSLESSMTVLFAVEKGTPKPFQLPNGDIGKGTLCWAEHYQLPDGTSCICLKQFTGDLWLRSAELGQPKRQLDIMLWKDYSSLRWRGYQVVHLADEVSYDYSANETPWDYLATKDESGRTWGIMKSKLSFGGSLRLEVVGRYNDRLNQRSCLTLTPPYEAVWSPKVTDQLPERLYIPFTLQ